MRVVEINENTKVPLRIVVGLASVLIGGTFWLTTMYVVQSGANTRIEKLEKKMGVLSKIDRRLYRLELAEGLEPEPFDDNGD